MLATINSGESRISRRGDIHPRRGRWRLDEDGCTPLTYAAEKGHYETVQMLINSGADVNSRRSNKTALSDAAKEGQENCVVILIEAGADVNVKLPYDTVLLKATRSRNLKCIEALIKAGADVNEVGTNVNVHIGDLNNFVTPLVEAARFGFEDGVNLLLRAGANVNRGKDKNRSAVIYPLQSAVDRHWSLEMLSCFSLLKQVETNPSLSLTDALNERFKIPQGAAS